MLVKQELAITLLKVGQNCTIKELGHGSLCIDLSNKIKSLLL